MQNKMFKEIAKSMPNYSQKITFAKLQSTLCKIQIICIFLLKNLHISKKSSTFAPDLINKCLTNKNSQL